MTAGRVEDLAVQWASVPEPGRLHNVPAFKAARRLEGELELLDAVRRWGQPWEVARAYTVRVQPAGRRVYQAVMCGELEESLAATPHPTGELGELIEKALELAADLRRLVDVSQLRHRPAAALVHHLTAIARAVQAKGASHAA